jgi:hypothetical protein
VGSGKEIRGVGCRHPRSKSVVPQGFEPWTFCAPHELTSVKQTRYQLRHKTVAEVALEKRDLLRDINADKFGSN